MIIFSVLVLVLVFRPTGLFGRITAAKILRPDMVSPSTRTWSIGEALAAPFRRLSSDQQRRLILTLVTIAAVAFPLIDRNEGDIDAAANATAFAVLALGLNIVVGFAGLFDLGYAAFFAIGAYFYGVISSWQLQPEWASFWEPLRWLGVVVHYHANGERRRPLHALVLDSDAARALVAAFFGVLFGAPTLRLRGDYLAIVTLGFGEIVPIVVRNYAHAHQRRDGTERRCKRRPLFGYSFGVELEPLLLSRRAAHRPPDLRQLRLQDSRVGRAWIAIREDEIAAAAMGVNRTKLKLLAFAVGAGFAGHDRHLLRRQAADRDAGHVHVPGLGHDPGHDRAGRHGQRLRRGAGGRHPAAPAILVPPGPDGLGARAGPRDRHRLAAARSTSSQSIELIFGIILVLMMLYRRQGLIPATRATRRSASSSRRHCPRAGPSTSICA